MNRLIPYLVLTLGVFLAYANTLQNSFHYDDFTSILKSPWIRGLDKIPDFIFSWAQRPLLILTFNLNFSMSEFEVWSWHLFNILGHLIVTLLLYHFARLILSAINSHKADDDPWKGFPFLAAMLFAVHPLHTQSVTYIASRSTVLVTIFYLASIICFSHWMVERKSGQSTSPKKVLLFVLGILFFFAGGLSKEIIMTLPAMAFLFHFYFIGDQKFKPWLLGNLKWFLMGAAIFGGAITYQLVTAGRILPATYSGFSNSTYLLTQTFVIPFEYLKKMLFPFNLSIDVGFPIIHDWGAVSSYLGLVTLGLLVWGITRLRQPTFAFGLCWALITVLPTSSFVPLLDVAVEHRTYLPLVGFSIAMAAALCSLLRSLLREKPVSSGTWTRWGLALILICFFMGTVDRNRVWKNEMTLWADAKTKAPHLIRVYNNLGEAYDKMRLYPEAIREFEQTLKIDPNYFFGLNNLGNIYGKMAQYDKAIHYFNKALQAKHDYAPAFYNLATAYVKTNRPLEAMASYQKAIEHDPYLEQAYSSLANLSLQLGKLSVAVENFKKFLEFKPNHARARFGLANAYMQGQRFDLALVEYEKAAALDPRFIFPKINIATIYLQQGKVDEAISTYNEILATQPKVPGVHKNLGMIYSQYRPNPEKALYHFEESLRLDPNQAQGPIIKGVIADLKKTLESNKTSDQ